jgi:hypothetical protein
MGISEFRMFQYMKLCSPCSQSGSWGCRGKGSYAAVAELEFWLAEAFSRFVFCADSGVLIPGIDGCEWRCESRESFWSEGGGEGDVAGGLAKVEAWRGEDLEKEKPFFGEGVRALSVLRRLTSLMLLKSPVLFEAIEFRQLRIRSAEGFLEEPKFSEFR